MSIIPPVPRPAAAPPPVVLRSRLESVPQGKPFSIDAYVNERAATPKQHYEQPPAPKVEEPASAVAATAPGVEVGQQTYRKSAQFVIGMIDRVQANAFALVAKNEDPEVFRMKPAEADELADYLEVGIEQMKWRIPWWLPFILCMALIGFANYKRAIKIKKELKPKPPVLDIVRDDAVSRLTNVADNLAKEVLKKKQQARTTPPPAPVPAGKCEYCGKAIAAGKRFCNRKHAALFQHRHKDEVKPAPKPAAEPVVKKVEAPPPPPAPVLDAAVPLVLTNDMADKLRTLGKSETEINAMTPQQAILFIEANKAPAEPVK